MMMEVITVVSDVIVQPRLWTGAVTACQWTEAATACGQKQ